MGKGFIEPWKDVLPAASIGEAVPRENFDARVQSVFHSAANLRLTDAGRLITLLISDHYELPQGIRITAKDALLQDLRVELRAACRGGILQFESFPVAIDLRRASVWKCRVPALNANLQSPAAIRAWSSAWKTLNKQQKRENAEVVAGDLFQLNAGPRLSQRLSLPVLRLVTSTAHFNLQGSILAVEKMIGLGPGVTPSGDDILIGFLAGLWSTTDQNEDRLAFLDAFGRRLMQCAKQTGEISRTYLLHATWGQFSSSLSQLAGAIANGDLVDRVMKETMHVGHSSGMDSVTGLLIGLRVWNADVHPAKLVPIFMGLPLK